MPLRNLQIHRSLSTFSSNSPTIDSVLADQALTLLKRHPYQLDSFSPHFTPEAAFDLLLKTQSDQSLTLKFLKWAQPQSFFTPKLRCLAVHILTKFKLYKTAQILAQDLALNLTRDDGNFVFSCLKETYRCCDSGSGSAVIDLVVKSYSNLNMIDKAVNIVNLAKVHGFMPGVLSYNAILDSVIRSRGNNWVKFAKDVYDEMSKNKISPNVFTYNILIRGFCGAGDLEKALRFFSEMEKNRCLANVVTYNTLIDGYCKLGRIGDAFKLLRDMGLKGIELNLISYNVIINGLCREGRLKETGDILKEMSRKGLLPNEVTYNTLVNGYCKGGNFHQALVLHAEMVRNGLSPNVVTYTSLINSMCKSGNLNRAMEFFEQMHVRGLHPNERTYTTLIDGFSQQGFLNEAYRLLNEMKNNGFVPSLVTYNSLINGHCIAGRVEEALGVIQGIVEEGLAPDVVSYSTVISGFCKNQELDRAFNTKREMVEKGVSPDTVTYSSLIQGLCDQRRITEACELLQEMLGSGLPPDEFTYTTLINAYCTEGDISKALHLHDEMIKSGLLPDVVTYSVLINGLNKQARTREAKRLLLKLFYEESVPNDLVYNTLIENCSGNEFKSVVALLKGFCMKGLMNQADRAFESMLQRGHKPNEAVYDVIIHGHSKSGNVQKAYGMYKEMACSGFVPHSVTVIALVKALLAANMNEELSQVIKNILGSCRVTDAELSKVLVQINHQEGNMDAVLNVLTEMAKDGLIPNNERIPYGE